MPASCHSFYHTSLAVGGGLSSGLFQGNNPRKSGEHRAEGVGCGQRVVGRKREPRLEVGRWTDSC